MDKIIFLDYWDKLIRYFDLYSLDKENVLFIENAICKIVYDTLIYDLGKDAKVNVLGFDNKKYSIELTEDLIRDIIEVALEHKDLKIGYKEILCHSDKRYLINPKLSINYSYMDGFNKVARHIMEYGYSDYLFNLIQNYNYGVTSGNIVFSKLYNSVEVVKIYLDKEPKILKSKNYIMLNDPIANEINFESDDWVIYYILLKNTKVKPKTVISKTEQMIENNVHLTNNLRDNNINTYNYVYRILTGMKHEQAIEIGRREFKEYGLNFYNNAVSMYSLLLTLLKEKFNAGDNEERERDRDRDR